MDLTEARELVRRRTHKDITVRHLVSVEGVMRALARRLGQDEHRWALAGLFHDLDQDQTGEDLERHAFLAADWLLIVGRHTCTSCCAPMWTTTTTTGRIGRCGSQRRAHPRS